jgi:hypothetical protein
MHVRACFKHDVGSLSPGFTTRYELAKCQVAALEKRKVPVTLHLAYLPVN